MDIGEFPSKDNAITPANVVKSNEESLLHVILWHRWTILLTTVIFIIAALIYILKVTPIYTSESRVYVEQTGPKIISDYEGIMTQSKNYLNTQGVLIKSNPIISEVIQDRQIINLDTFTGVDNLSAYLKKNLKVDIGGQDDIITVSFDSPYPVEAAQIVNAVMDSYVNYHTTQKRSTVTEVLKILQKEKVKRDEELSDKFASLLQFTRENGIVSLNNDSGNIIIEKLKTLSEALTEAQLLTLNAKADYEAAQSMSNEPEKIRQLAQLTIAGNAQIYGNERENQLRNELRQAELELKEVLGYCTEEHPSVIAINKKIQAINLEIDEYNNEFSEAYIEVMQLRYQAAKQKENELQVSFEEQQFAAREIGIKAVEYTTLQSELERAERVCEILDDRIKELNVTEDAGALNISILEVARPAQHPSKPQKAKLLILALILGLTTGTSLALLQDWMDYRLRSSEEISALLGIPVLGEVPAISDRPDSKTYGWNSNLDKIRNIISKMFNSKRISSDAFIISQHKGFLTDRNLMTRAKSYRTALASERSKMSWHDATKSYIRQTKSDFNSMENNCHGQIIRLRPRSVVAEAYRTIRTSISFGALSGQAKSILITSPTPGDGKSTLTSNLAIAMAQTGQKTLLIDADLRKPTQHKIFNISMEIGLSNILIGAIEPDAAIQQGPVKGLDILPCGQKVPNPSETLNNDAFALVLQNFTKLYDRIIIDSPPVVPVADSKIIAARCDTSLLVIKADKTTRRLAQIARDNLAAVGCRIIGTVVNGVTQKNGRYGYGRYYGSYGNYSQYYGEDEHISNKKIKNFDREVTV